MGVYEGLLGLKRTLDGLRVAPCFPSAWEHAEATRRFRGADYHILYFNPERLENGRPEITADGQLINGDLLPDYQDGRLHEIAVVLRER